MGNWPVTSFVVVLIPIFRIFVPSLLFYGLNDDQLSSSHCKLVRLLIHDW